MCHRRNRVLLAASAAILVGLAGCMPNLGGVRAVNVPAAIEPLAVLPPARPASPDGPVPQVRVARAAAPVQAAAGPAAEGSASSYNAVPEEIAVADEDSEAESSSDLAMIARGIGALQSLEQIVGASEADVRNRIGEPMMVAPRPPGIEWNYREGDCVLQVYFFMELATRDFRVLSYDLTGDDTDARRQCATRFTGEQQGEPSTDATG